MFKSLSKGVIFGLILFALIVLLIVYNIFNNYGWSEWTPLNPTCGSGTQTRKCTANSIVQGLGCSIGFGSETQTFTSLPCPFKGRYVRLEVLGAIVKPQPLNVVDINVLDIENNSLVTSKATATASSTYGTDKDQFGVANIIKGNSSSRNKSGKYQFAHTSGFELAPWLEVDLGETKNIAKIVVLNRTDCCYNTILNANIEILDEYRNSIYKSPPITTLNPDHKYTFTAPSFL